MSGGHGYPPRAIWMIFSTLQETYRLGLEQWGDLGKSMGGGCYLRSVVAGAGGNLTDLGVRAWEISLVAVQSYRTSEMSPSPEFRIFLPLVMRRN